MEMVRATLLYLRPQRGRHGGRIEQRVTSDAPLGEERVIHPQARHPFDHVPLQRQRLTLGEYLRESIHRELGIARLGHDVDVGREGLPTTGKQESENECGMRNAE